MISLKQLSYALAVGKTKHFKKAAELCSVSQSALSNAISELERQLGVQLFERDNKQVLLTDIGVELLAKAKDILLEVDNLHLLAQSQNSRLNRRFTLGLIPTVGPYLLPKVLPAVSQQFPDLALNIVEDQSHILVEQVRDGDLDAAILALPYDTEGLHTFEFWSEDFYCIHHQSNKLGTGGEVSSEQLAKSNLLLLKNGHCLKDHALAVCQFATVGENQSLAATSLHTLIEMVAGRLGTTLVPEMAVEQLIRGNPELSSLRLNEPSPHRTIAFVVRLNYPRVKDVEALMAVFRQQLIAFKPAPSL